MMDLNKKDMLIAVGVTVGLAVLVLFMKNQNGGGNAAGGSGTGGTSDIVGGFTSASTVFVPTSSYDLNFNTYKGAVSYSTVTNNSASTTTTTYAPVNSNNNSPVNSPTVGNGSSVSGLVAVSPPAATSAPPVITTGSNNVVNIPTQQTNTAPVLKAPVEVAPPPSTPAWESALVSGYHYATPAGGWNPGSIVDNMKSHGFRSSFADQQQLASAMGIQGYQGTAAQNIQMLNTLKAAGL